MNGTWDTSISLNLDGLTLRVSYDRKQLMVNTGDFEFYRELTPTEWRELVDFVGWANARYHPPQKIIAPKIFIDDEVNGETKELPSDLLSEDGVKHLSGWTYDPSKNLLFREIPMNVVENLETLMDSSCLFAYPSLSSLPDYHGLSNRKRSALYLNRLFFERPYYQYLGNHKKQGKWNFPPHPYDFEFLSQTPYHNLNKTEYRQVAKDWGFWWANYCLSKVVKKLEEMPDGNIYQWGYVPHYINYMAYDTNAVEKCFFEGVNVAWGFMQKPVWLANEGQDDGHWVGAESFIFGRAQEIASIYDVPMNNAVLPNFSLEQRPKAYFFDIYFELPQEYDVTIKSVDTHIWLSLSTVLATPFNEYTRLTIKIYSKAEFKKAIDHITETYGDCVYHIDVNQVWEEMNGKVV